MEEAIIPRCLIHDVGKLSDYIFLSHSGINNEEVSSYVLEFDVSYFDNIIAGGELFMKISDYCDIIIVKVKTKKFKFFNTTKNIYLIRYWDKVLDSRYMMYSTILDFSCVDSFNFDLYSNSIDSESSS